MLTCAKCGSKVPAARYCDCPETQYENDDGAVIRFQAPDHGGARHDCHYTKLRSSLIPKAEAIATIEVPKASRHNAEPIDHIQWGMAFSREMERLAKPLIGLDPKKENPTA